MSGGELKAGARLRSVTSSAEVVVVRAPSEAVEIACGGPAMVPIGDGPAAASGPDSGLDEPVLLGKRYTDEESGLELLCTKAGPGTLTCAGRVMPLKDAKPLPSSD